MNEENVSIMLNSSNAFLLRNVQSITGGLRTWDYDLFVRWHHNAARDVTCIYAYTAQCTHIAYITNISLRDYHVVYVLK